MKQSLVFLCLLVAILPAIALGAGGTNNFAGEWADKNFRGGNSVFELSLEQTGSEVSISFSANRKDGGGAAPEADGKGKVSGDKLQFTWSDSFNNSGTGTIKKAGADVIISIKTTQVADSRCLMFYGDGIRLKPTK